MIFNWVVGLSIPTLIIAAISFAYWFGGRKNHWDQAASDVRGLKPDVSDLKHNMSGLKSDVGDLKEDISAIKSFVETLKTLLRPLFDISTASPLKLTDSGEKTAKSIHAYQLAEKYGDRVSLEKDANAYQIQQACFAFSEKELLSQLDKNERQHLEKQAFEQGTNVAHFLKIIGILIRDRVLQSRGMQSREIDDNAPPATG